MKNTVLIADLANNSLINDTFNINAYSVLIITFLVVILLSVGFRIARYYLN